MSFAGSNFTLQIFSPDLSNPITQVQTVAVSDVDIEYDNVDFFDISGDPFNVVPAQFDASGSYLQYTILDNGSFSSGNFNGYVATFSGVNIRNVELIASVNQLTIDLDRITFDSDQIFINVESLSFDVGANLVLLVSFNHVGGAGADTFNAGQGADYLWGYEDSDTLNGGAGDDVIDGGIGADAMRGGAGNDSYFVDNAGDAAIEIGAAGTDSVISTITYQIGNYVEQLTLAGTSNINGTGNGTQNTITGNSGNNILDGKASGDTLIGGLGDDLYVIDHTNDVVIENASAGTDTVKAYSNHVLSANVENLTMDGTAANGGGNALNNTIKGNDQNNVITGGDGNDSLGGGLGNDRLTGGAGRDVFIFNTIANASTNRDVITDFSVADDTIRLENDVFTVIGGGGTLNANFFHIGAAAASANHYIIYDSATGVLFYDWDGSGTLASQVRFATITPGLALTNADFFVI